jgi:hypothetical protein
LYPRLWPKCDQLLQALRAALLAALFGYRNLLQLTLNLSQLPALWWRKYMPAVAAYLRGADAGG